MELILPTTMTITIAGIGAFLTIFASVLGVYYKLNARFSSLEDRFVKMESRNNHADAETEAVKAEQAEQKTTVAVMAEQIGNQSRMMERMDRNIEELLKRGNAK